jgi:hypothetical protein
MNGSCDSKEEQRRNSRSSKKNVAYPTLLQILLTNTLPPWDIASFEKFCIRLHNVEVLRFWKIVQAWKSASDAERTAESADKIFKAFLLKDSEHLINIPGKLFIELNEKHQRLAQLSPEELRGLFDTAQQEMLHLMETGIYKHFIRDVILQKHILFAEDVARWWTDKDLTFKKFCSYPKLINAADARLFAFMSLWLWTSVLILATAVPSPTGLFAAEVIAFWTASAYLLRACFGPRLEPMSQFVLFVLRPFVEDKLNLIKSEFRSDAWPRRCAMILGSIFGWSGSILLFLSSKAAANHQLAMKAAGLSMLGFLAAMAFLVSCLDFCLMCYTYGMGQRIRRKFRQLESKFEQSVHASESSVQVNINMEVNAIPFPAPTSEMSVTKSKDSTRFSIMSKTSS